MRPKVKTRSERHLPGLLEIFPGQRVVRDERTGHTGWVFAFPVWRPHRRINVILRLLRTFCPAGKEHSSRSELPYFRSYQTVNRRADQGNSRHHAAQGLKRVLIYIKKPCSRLPEICNGRCNLH
jgi:hypothetical protein